MKKIAGALLLAALLLSGCNAVKLDKEMPENLAPETETSGDRPALPRVDVSGNPIETAYAEGKFVKTDAGLIHMEENGKGREFMLTQQAEQNLAALGLEAGQRIIVNFHTDENGRDIAESIEKIISE